jgi:protein SCO1/2
MVVWAIVSVPIFYNILKPIERLPVYQPASVNSELVDTTIVHKINYHKISDFTLTNQNGETVTQKKNMTIKYMLQISFLQLVNQSVQ